MIVGIFLFCQCCESGMIYSIPDPATVLPLRVQDPPPSGTGIILKAYLEILKITVH